MIDTLTVAQAADLAERGYKRLEPARRQGKAAYEAYVGDGYMADPTQFTGDEQASNSIKRPVNLTAQQVRTLLVALAYAAGTPEVSAKFAALEWDAEMRQAALEADTEKLNLVEKNQEVLIDAILFGEGYSRVGLKAGSRVFSDGGSELDPGELYEEPISFEDITKDPFARKDSECRFRGFRFRISRREAIEQGIYGRNPEDYDPGEEPPNPNIATRDEATVILQNLPKLKQGSPGSRLVSDMSQAGDSNLDDNDLIELWELEWKWRGEVYTVVVPANQGDRNVMGTADKFLLIEKSPIPEEGTLNSLSFLPVPNNIMPLGLEQLQKQLALVSDLLANKFIRQALRMKSNTIYRADAEDEMVNLSKSEDGEFIKGDPEAFTQVQQAGQLKELAGANAFFMDLWNNSTGNLQLKAGQSEITDTATAFQGLMGQVQGWMQFLTNRYEAFATRGLKRRAWFLEHDPLMDRMVPYRIDGTWTVPIRFTAAEKEGKYDDFAYRIRSGSTRFMDPILEGQQLIQLFTSALPSLLQLIAAGAYKPGAIRALHRKFGVVDMDQYLADPELMMARMAMQQQGPQPSKGQPGGRAMMGAGMATPSALPAATSQQPQQMNSRSIDAGRSAAMGG